MPTPEEATERRAGKQLDGDDDDDDKEEEEEEEGRDDRSTCADRSLSLMNACAARARSVSVLLAPVYRYCLRRVTEARCRAVASTCRERPQPESSCEGESRKEDGWFTIEEEETGSIER